MGYRLEYVVDPFGFSGESYVVLGSVAQSQTYWISYCPEKQDEMIQTLFEYSIIGFLICISPVMKARYLHNNDIIAPQSCQGKKRGPLIELTACLSIYLLT